MHEIAIVENSFQVILEVAKKENLTTINRVSFLIGEMHGIVPGIFQHAFESAAAQTIAENAELNLEMVPIRMQCNTCGGTFAIKNSHYQCPGCRGADLEIINGKELTIKSIEGE